MSYDNATDLSGFLSQAKPTLVEFYRPDCARYGENVEVIAELRQRLGDRANIVTVNGHAQQDLMTAYKVDKYPTFILFKDGQEAWRDSGHKPLSELEHMVRSFI